MRDPPPIAKIFLKACSDAGLPLLNEHCAGDQEGAFLSLATQRGGERWSAARGYLEDARKRPNLAVWTDTPAHRIEFEGKRAVGVWVRHEGSLQCVRPRREIILSAGSIGSPAL